MKSWQTTLSGMFCVACAAALIGIRYYRGETLTDVGWMTVGGLLAAGYGLLRAQDAVKPNPSSKFLKPKLVLLACCLMLVGCGKQLTTFSVTSDEVTANNTPGSGVRMDAEGHLTAMYEGAPPSGAMQDESGTWVIQPGAVGILTVDPTTGKLYIASPKDVVMTGVKITPKPKAGEPFFQADTVTANLSPVAAVYERQYASAVEGLKGMTAEAARVQIKAWETTGEILPDVAQMLIQSFVPTLP